MKRRIQCTYKIDSPCMEFLTRHTGVHLRQDWRMAKADPRHSFSAHYILAFSALKEFGLAGTLSIFNGAIGAIALSSNATSQTALKFV